MGFERQERPISLRMKDENHLSAVPFGKAEYQMYVMDLAENIPRMVSTGHGACTCGFFRLTAGRLFLLQAMISPSEMPKGIISGI